MLRSPKIMLFGCFLKIKVTYFCSYMQNHTVRFCHFCSHQTLEMQVLMVIFDILASHHRMLTWHEQRIEEHLTDLEQLHQLKLEDAVKSENTDELKRAESQPDLKNKILKISNSGSPENGHASNNLINHETSEAGGYSAENKDRQAFDTL